MKVFISSTYKDLIEYRAAAIRAVEGTNYQASKMEVFGARPEEPLDACLKEVDLSLDRLGLFTKFVYRNHSAHFSPLISENIKPSYPS